MQSWARDNTAANTEHYLQATKVLVIVLCLYSLWQLHLDSETLIFWYFFCHGSSITLSRCRCREAKKMSRAQLCSDVRPSF